jgi:hypothetical protein
LLSPLRPLSTTHPMMPQQIVSCHALSYSIMSWIVTRRVHIPMHK